MVLRVKPTLTRFPTKSLYTPMGSTPLHSISSVCHPWVMTLLTLITKIHNKAPFTAALVLWLHAS